MLSDNAKIILGAIIVLALLYYVNTYSSSPTPNAGNITMAENKANSKKLDSSIYPGQVYGDTGDYNNGRLSVSKNDFGTLEDRGDTDEWDAYFNQNNSITGRAQIREFQESYKPLDESGGLYANYDVPLKKRRNKVNKKMISDGSFDPDMYDPENLLPQEYDEDWFEVIDKPINLKGRLLRLENPLGINTINETLKVPNLDLRPSPPCPKMNISPWNNSTVEPDTNIKTLY
jgi:hypothetical protein